MNENKTPIPRSTLNKMKPYVPGKSIKEVARKYNIKNLIKMASNENPLGCAVKDISALTQTFSDVFYYPSYSTSALIEKLAKKFDVQNKNIILGNGSDEIITMTAMAYLNPDEEVLTSEHTFSQYEFAALMMNGTIKTVPMKNHTFDRLTNKLTEIF